jgi:SAM-dependent methyltransferase
VVSHRVEAFAALLLTQLAPKSRILEIGCGAGELAALLIAAGHDVVAIDRKPRPEFPVPPVSFEDFDAAGAGFDCVIALLVLHHVEALDAMLDKVVAVLAPGGIVAVDDYGWERLAERTAEDRAWREHRQDLHPSTVMLAALDRVLDRRFYYDHAYFDEGLGTDRLAFTYFGRLEI